MDTPETKHTQTHSFFDANVTRVENAGIEDLADKELLAAVMTMQDLLGLLHDPLMNVINDIEEEFLVEVQVDVKKIINSLRTYQGKPRTGVREAKESMDQASLRIYDAQVAAHDKQPTAKAAALIASGVQLDSAYSQLQQWESQAQEVRDLEDARQQQASQSDASDIPAGAQPASGPASNSENPPLPL